MSSTYDRAFFADRGGSARSAAAIAPYVVDLLRPASVVDVGCGTGEWLAAFREHGIDDVHGVDGAYVDRERLAIPPDRFHAHDLAAPLELGRSFDLALCLEVGEHLPREAAAHLVDGLVRAAPLVLFGAAIPDQRGEGHVNEQWQEWWAALFAERGRLVVDAVRRPFWKDDRVEWWYVQNTLLYVSPDELARRPRLRELHEHTAPELLSLVHPKGYLSFRGRPARHRLRLGRG